MTGQQNLQSQKARDEEVSQLRQSQDANELRYMVSKLIKLFLHKRRQLAKPFGLAIQDVLTKVIIDSKIKSCKERSGHSRLNLVVHYSMEVLRRLADVKPIDLNLTQDSFVQSQLLELARTLYPFARNDCDWQLVTKTAQEADYTKEDFLSEALMSRNVTKNCSQLIKIFVEHEDQVPRREHLRLEDLVDIVKKIEGLRQDWGKHSKVQFYCCIDSWICYLDHVAIDFNGQSLVSAILSSLSPLAPHHETMRKDYEISLQQINQQTEPGIQEVLLPQLNDHVAKHILTVMDIALFVSHTVDYNGFLWPFIDMMSHRYDSNVALHAQKNYFLTSEARFRLITLATENYKFGMIIDITAEFLMNTLYEVRYCFPNDRSMQIAMLLAIADEMELSAATNGLEFSTVIDKSLNILHILQRYELCGPDYDVKRQMVVNSERTSYEAEVEALASPTIKARVTHDYLHNAVGKFDDPRFDDGQRKIHERRLHFDRLSDPATREKLNLSLRRIFGNPSVDEPKLPEIARLSLEAPHIRVIFAKQRYHLDFQFEMFRRIEKLVLSFTEGQQQFFYSCVDVWNTFLHLALNVSGGIHWAMEVLRTSLNPDFTTAVHKLLEGLPDGQPPNKSLIQTFIKSMFERFQAFPRDRSNKRFLFTEREVDRVIRVAMSGDFIITSQW